MAKKTNLPLDFRLLTWKDFEKLCYELLNEEGGWKNIDALGSAGNGDRGIDIKGIKKETNEIWIVQCKNWRKVTLKELKAEIDSCQEEITENHIYVLMLGCIMAANNRIEFIKYAKSKGFGDAYIKTSAELEPQIYASKLNLLERYFGEKSSIDTKIEQLRHREKMKQEVKERLIRPELDKDVTIELWKYLQKDPNCKFVESEVIVIPIEDDDSFPNFSLNEKSRWFYCTFNDLYEDGIELHLRAAQGTEIIMSDDGYWQPLLGELSFIDTPRHFKRLKVRMIGRIPYSSICYIQMDADNIEDRPGLYCRFEFKKSPFEEVYYKHIDNKGHLKNYPVLEEKNMKTLI